MPEFKISLDDKPYLSSLLQTDKTIFKDIVGTFVNLMEVAASNGWYKLPDNIHTSLSFSDIVGGILNAIMTTEQINTEAYSTLGDDIHPLALLSDKRKNIITGEPEEYDWRSHFILDSEEVSKETIEVIIRKMLYLMRWFDIDTVSSALIANQFPIVRDTDIRKLPFQPALIYQQLHLGELHVGKFFHDVGAFDCGGLENASSKVCPACVVGELKYIGVDDKGYHVCPRCNSGFELKEELAL